ncbi:hypothetical protein [Chryseobacterium sp. MP_3.2]|uniref:hypothetical protein n=1 Tax=Chryseobacterium sp. MP_3.2 TaxID=3071712 RepID=UPI002DFEDD39|nr:hypothetical protein [Chryseobacterium sp. MP_3.2]
MNFCDPSKGGEFCADHSDGISRRSGARNEGAVFAIKRAMEMEPNLKVTLPNYELANAAKNSDHRHENKTPL